jgi:hypothetical protein
MQIMCVNNILAKPAIFPLSTGSSEAVVAMEEVHADSYCSKYLSEYNCRRSR